MEPGVPFSRLSSFLNDHEYFFKRST